MPALIPLFSFPRLLTLLSLLLFSSIALAADSVISVSSTSVTVTPDIITTQLKEVEASTELDDAIKSTLTKFYRKALGNLEKEKVSAQAEKSFSSALETTPSELKTARKDLEVLKQKDLTITLKVSEKTPLAEVGLALLKEKVNQAELSAKLNELEKQLAMEAKRPSAIRKRISSRRNRQEVIDKELKQAVSPEELPRLSEAKQWSLMSEQRAF